MAKDIEQLRSIPRMKVCLDAQLPPALAPWISTTFGIDCLAVRDLGRRDADDQTIDESDL